MGTLKKDQYACKGGPEKFFFLPGNDLPAVIQYKQEDGFNGFYRRVKNYDTGQITYVWELKK